MLLNSGDFSLQFLKPLFISCCIFFHSTPHFLHKRSIMIQVDNCSENRHAAVFSCSAHSRVCPFPPLWSARWAPSSAPARQRLSLERRRWASSESRADPKSTQRATEEDNDFLRKPSWRQHVSLNGLFEEGLTPTWACPCCGCSLRGCCNSWIRLCNHLELRTSLLTEGYS